MITGAGEEVLTARAAGLTGCQSCGLAWPAGTPECGRCGATLRSVNTRRLQAVWAWLFAGIVFYIPANIMPMLRTNTLFGNSENTIIGGAVELAMHGSWGVAAVVFVASVVVPIGKFIVIAYLALVVGARRPIGDRRHFYLYEVVEFIGRWSMIDVFVVAILAALVQLGIVVSINPGPAAAAFALSVAFTMLSAQSFDPRLIWRYPVAGTAEPGTAAVSPAKAVRKAETVRNE